MGKASNPVDAARKEEKRKAKAKNAKARKAAREAPKKAEGSLVAAGPTIVPGQDGRVIIPGAKGKQGRDPRRSIYYDPVFNPYGAPPPGFEYKERDPSPEVEPDDSDDSDSDDGIELPEGPKPETDSDDDIPMPEGPPPSQAAAPLLNRPAAPPIMAMPAMPLGFPIPQGGLPFPPQHQPPIMQAPPQFRPRMPLPHHNPFTGSSQQPFQAYRNGPMPPMQSASLMPPRPPRVAPTAEALEDARRKATLTAEPQLRDLRKEAVTFVPTAVKRKRTTQAASAAGIVGQVNAAPSSPEPEPDEDAPAPEPAASARMSLLGAVRDAIGPDHKRAKAGETDLERFQAGVADLL